jgi:hypothetical protein
MHLQKLTCSTPMLLPPRQVNVGSMLPITATQFGVNRMLEQAYLRTFDGQQPNVMGKIAMAMGAGGASAFFGCPTEFVVIQQQKNCRPLFTEASHIFKNYGPLILYKGLVSFRARLGEGHVCHAEYRRLHNCAPRWHHLYSLPFHAPPPRGGITCIDCSSMHPPPPSPAPTAERNYHAGKPVRHGVPGSCPHAQAAAATDKGG